METQDLTVYGNKFASPAMDLFPESEFDLTNSMNSVLIVRMLSVSTINVLFKIWQLKHTSANTVSA